MEAIPRKYGEWGQFDRYCKLVLYHEAIKALSVMERSMTKCQEKNEMKKDGTTKAAF